MANAARSEPVSPAAAVKTETAETRQTKTATFTFASLIAEPLQHPGKQAVPIR